MYESRSTGPAPEWTAEAKALIEEVQAARPPEAPFLLAPWAHVVDPARFHARVLEDISHGPGGPRALTGGLVAELRLYVEVLRGGK
jgi:hypothetical protein